VVVIASGGGWIVSDRTFVADCAGLLESVTRKVNGAFVTAAVGVPLSTPVDAFRVMPAGSVPAVSAQVYGSIPPAAVKVCEYAVFTCPFGSDAVVIVKAGSVVRERLLLTVPAGLAESVTLNVT
jgi:hypothetical protein